MTKTSDSSASLTSAGVTDRPCIDCLHDAAPLRPDRLEAPRPTAFWLVAGLFAVVMLGTTLPTPLYVTYQARCHFSAGIITLVFATYAAGFQLPSRPHTPCQLHLLKGVQR